MISEPSAVQHIGTHAASRDWSFWGPIPQKSLDVVVAFARGTIRGLKSFVQAPVLPSAALWEANTLVHILSDGERAEYDPDPFSTEAPFLSDSWPRDM
jgi:hypothetical protein